VQWSATHAHPGDFIPLLANAFSSSCSGASPKCTLVTRTLHHRLCTPFRTFSPIHPCFCPFLLCSNVRFSLLSTFTHPSLIYSSIRSFLFVFVPVPALFSTPTRMQCFFFSICAFAIIRWFPSVPPDPRFVIFVFHNAFAYTLRCTVDIAFVLSFLSHLCVHALEFH
jgi:hypothetical protein